MTQSHDDLPKFDKNKSAIHVYTQLLKDLDELLAKPLFQPPFYEKFKAAMEKIKKNYQDKLAELQSSKGEIDEGKARDIAKLYNSEFGRYQLVKNAADKIHAMLMKIQDFRRKIHTRDEMAKVQDQLNKFVTFENNYHLSIISMLDSPAVHVGSKAKEIEDQLVRMGRELELAEKKLEQLEGSPATIPTSVEKKEPQPAAAAPSSTPKPAAPAPAVPAAAPAVLAEKSRADALGYLRIDMQCSSDNKEAVARQLLDQARKQIEKGFKKVIIPHYCTVLCAKFKIDDYIEKRSEADREYVYRNFVTVMQKDPTPNIKKNVLLTELQKLLENDYKDLKGLIKILPIASMNPQYRGKPSPQQIAKDNEARSKRVEEDLSAMQKLVAADKSIIIDWPTELEGVNPYPDEKDKKRIEAFYAERAKVLAEKKPEPAEKKEAKPASAPVVAPAAPAPAAPAASPAAVLSPTKKVIFQLREDTRLLIRFPSKAIRDVVVAKLRSDKIELVGDDAIILGFLDPKNNRQIKLPLDDDTQLQEFLKLIGLRIEDLTANKISKNSNWPILYFQNLDLIAKKPVEMRLSTYLEQLVGSPAPTTAAPVVEKKEKKEEKASATTATKKKTDEPAKKAAEPAKKVAPTEEKVNLKPVTFRTDKARKQHPLARKINDDIWKLYFAPSYGEVAPPNEFTVEQQILMTIPLQTLLAKSDEEFKKLVAVERLNVGRAFSAGQFAWYCVAIGNPHAQAEDLILLAKKLNLPLTQLIDIAAAGGQLDFINQVIAQPDAVKNLTENDLRDLIRAIHYAAAENHLDIIQLLITKFPTLKDSINKYSPRAYDMAAKNGHIQIMRYFEKLGPQTAIDLVKGQLFDAVNQAVMGGQIEVLKHLERIYPNLYQQIFESSRPWQLNIGFGNLIGLSIQHGHIKTLSYLVERNLGNDRKGSEVLGWIIKEDVITNLLKFAIINDHIEILDYFKNNSLPLFEKLIKANNYDFFVGAATVGPVRQIKYLKDAAPNLFIEMLKAGDFAAYPRALASGDPEVIAFLEQEATKNNLLSAMIKGQDYACYGHASPNKKLMEHIERLVPADSRKMIEGNHYLAYRRAAAKNNIEIMQYLERKMPGMVSRMIAAENFDAFNNGGTDAKKRLLEDANCFAHAELHHAMYGQEYVYPFVTAKITALKTRRDAVVAARSPFDLTDPNEKNLCFYIIRNLIRRNDRDLDADLQFLLSIPSVRALAHTAVTPNQHNELLRLATFTNNQIAARMLLAIPGVRQLAEQENYYRAERRGEMDLSELARDREGAMVGLTKDEEKLLAKVENKYRPQMQQEGGASKCIEELIKMLISRYEKNPAKIKIKDKEVSLPATWNEFQELVQQLGLQGADYKNALIAYYKHTEHSAWRYFLKPNPWIADNAAYVEVSANRRERWADMGPYRDQFAMLYLAVKDTAAPVGDDDTIENRIFRFIDALALINRAHNWDRERKSPTGKTEFYDDLEGDKPSCFPGIKRRLFGAAKGHPLMNSLSFEVVKAELYSFVREHFLKVIAQEKENKNKLNRAYYNYMFDIGPLDDDSAALKLLDIKEDQQKAFEASMEIKYPGEFKSNETFVRYVKDAFKLVEGKRGEDAHAVKFDIDYINLKGMLGEPLPADVLTKLASIHTKTKLGSNITAKELTSIQSDLVALKATVARLMPRFKVDKEVYTHIDELTRKLDKAIDDMINESSNQLSSGKHLQFRYKMRSIDEKLIKYHDLMKKLTDFITQLDKLSADYKTFSDPKQTAGLAIKSQLAELSAFKKQSIDFLNSMKIISDKDILTTISDEVKKIDNFAKNLETNYAKLQEAGKLIGNIKGEFYGTMKATPAAPKPADAKPVAAEAKEVKAPSAPQSPKAKASPRLFERAKPETKDEQPKKEPPKAKKPTPKPKEDKEEVKSARAKKKQAVEPAAPAKPAVSPADLKKIKDIEDTLEDYKTKLKGDKKKLFAKSGQHKKIKTKIDKIDHLLSIITKQDGKSPLAEFATEFNKQDKNGKTAADVLGKDRGNAVNRLLRKWKILKKISGVRVSEQIARLFQPGPQPQGKKAGKQKGAPKANK